MLLAGQMAIQIINILIVLAVMAVVVYFLMVSLRVLRKMDKALDIWLEQNSQNKNNQE